MANKDKKEKKNERSSHYHYHQKTPATQVPVLAEADDPSADQRSWGRLGKTSVAGRRGRSWRTSGLKTWPDGIKWTPSCKSGNSAAPGERWCKGKADFWASTFTWNPDFLPLLCELVICFFLPGLSRCFSPACEVWESRASAFVLTKTLIGTGAWARVLILFSSSPLRAMAVLMAGIFEVVTLWDKS